MIPSRRSGAEAIACSAIENAGRNPITRSALVTALSTGEGDPSHVRALFGDVSLSTLMRLAIEFGISDAVLAQAYANARRNCAARNPDLDSFAAEFGHELDLQSFASEPVT